MQTLIIIFLISFIGIIVLINSGVSRARQIEREVTAHPIGKRIGNVGHKIKIIISYLVHSLAIFLSKIWARISHSVSTIYKKISSKIGNHLKQKQSVEQGKKVIPESIIITTIKAYKKEMKKLKEKVEQKKIKTIEADSEKVDIEVKKFKMD